MLGHNTPVEVAEQWQTLKPDGVLFTSNPRGIYQVARPHSATRWVDEKLLQREAHLGPRSSARDYNI